MGLFDGFTNGESGQEAHDRLQAEQNVKAQQEQREHQDGCGDCHVTQQHKIGFGG